MNDNYKTVAKNVSVEFYERKSRFIAHVTPVNTEEEAISFINSIKTKYWDATHNVYAYCVGEGAMMAARYSDDGEPQGTAGLPVFEVIRKNQLQNICIVVSRYFGGILLGASGLVRAYGKSASLGVEEAGIIEIIQCWKIDVIVEYGFFDKLQHVLNQQQHMIDNVEYGQDVKVSVMVEEENIEDFSKMVTDITSGACLMERAGKGYYKRPLQN